MFSWLLQEQRNPLLGRTSGDTGGASGGIGEESGAFLFLSSVHCRWNRSREDETIQGSYSEGRVLDRSGAFHQSRGKWRVVHLQHASRLCLFQQKDDTSARSWSCWDDWFHTLAYQRTIVLMGILFMTYSCIVVSLQ